MHYMFSVLSDNSVLKIFLVQKVLLTNFNKCEKMSLGTLWKDDNCEAYWTNSNLATTWKLLTPFANTSTFPSNWLV